VDTVQLLIIGRLLSCVRSPVDRHGNFRSGERRLREPYLRPIAAHLRSIGDPRTSVDEIGRRRDHYRRLHPSSRSHFRVSFLFLTVVPLSLSSSFSFQHLLLVPANSFHDR